MRGPAWICVGADGNLWFTENLKGAIATSTLTGLITEFDYPNSQTGGITAGPDGRLWFTLAGGSVGQITTSGMITAFALPTVGAGPSGITVGPDGNIWVAESGVDKIARITPAGAVTEFPVSPPPGAFLSVPTGITAATDGNLWFTEFFGSSIGRMTPGGVVTHFPLPSPYSNSMPFGITATADGTVWFTEWRYSLIGRIQVPIVIPSPTPTPTPTQTPTRTPSAPPAPETIPRLDSGGWWSLAILITLTGGLLASRNRH